MAATLVNVKKTSLENKHFHKRENHLLDHSSWQQGMGVAQQVYQQQQLHHHRGFCLANIVGLPWPKMGTSFMGWLPGLSLESDPTSILVQLPKNSFYTWLFLQIFRFHQRRLPMTCWTLVNRSWGWLYGKVHQHLVKKRALSQMLPQGSDQWESLCLGPLQTS